MVAQRHSRSTWREVSRAEPCEVCGSDHWCEVADDGTRHCMRKDNGGPEWDKRQGGWLHRTTDADWRRTAPVRQLTPLRTAAQSAPIHTVDAVYTRLVALCPLSIADRDYLKTKAGHTDDMIAGAYGTLPRQDQQTPMMATLEHEFGASVLRTIPGVVDVGDGELRVRGAGLLIAVRDHQGSIQAMQLRVSLPDGGKLYRWLSSKKDGGPSSGAPAHIARSPRKRDHRIYFCESPKTATYLAHALGATVVALAGISNHRPALDAAAAMSQEEGAEVAVLLLDAVDPSDDDAEQKERHTEWQRQALAVALWRMNYHVKIGRWTHDQGKGPDDMMLAGHAFTCEVYAPPADDAAELRAYKGRVVAITQDKAMSDGLKLTAIALEDRIPAGAGPHAAVTVAAGTLARDLGSPVTPSKKPGQQPRPTRQTTINNHLCDLVALGAYVREPVEVVKMIQVEDEDGHKVQQEIVVQSYRYERGASLPGHHMTPQAAREASPAATADRTRPRCPRCFSLKLKPSAHVCTDCDTVSSDVDAIHAGEIIVKRPDGRYLNRETGEEITPGVPPEGEWEPVTGFQSQGHADNDDAGEDGAEAAPAPTATAGHTGTDPFDWNPVTPPITYLSDLNPVKGPTGGRNGPISIAADPFTDMWEEGDV